MPERQRDVHNTKDREIHGEGNEWRTTLRHKKSEHLMQMLGLKRAVGYGNQYVHVLRREDGDVLRRALDFEMESQRKKCKPKTCYLLIRTCHEKK